MKQQPRDLNQPGVSLKINFSLNHFKAMTVKNLLEAVTFCGKIINSKPVIPIVEYLLFENGRVHATNLTITLWASLGEPCGSFLLPFKPVRDLLKKLPANEQVKILSNEKEILIDVGAYHVTYKAENIGEFPKLAQADAYAGMITETDVQTIITAASFCSGDGLREALTGIYMNNEIAATDGVKLFYKKTEGYIHPTHIAPQAVGRLLQGFQFAEVYTNDPTENLHTVELTNNARGIVYRIIDANFPAYKKVLPKQKDYVIDFQVDRNQLINAVKIANENANKHTRQIVVDVLNDGITVASNDLDYGHEFKTTVIPYTKNKSQIRLTIGFNGLYLLHILKQSKSETVRFKMFAANKPVLIDGNIILMPVML
jgi:DNA polymerase III sliding clamp (beta) subunit (PCNA family)